VPGDRPSIPATVPRLRSIERCLFLHDAGDTDIPVGTATIRVEIVEQLPSVDVVYVPMGDTALIRGVASAVKQRRPSARIIGVVADQGPAYCLSWTAGSVVKTDSANTITDGLAVRRPLAPNVAAIRHLVDEMERVTEQELRDAIALLHSRERVVAEPVAHLNDNLSRLGFTAQSNRFFTPFISVLRNMNTQIMG
jgi:threonine dehydratase